MKLPAPAYRQAQGGASRKGDIIYIVPHKPRLQGETCGALTGQRYLGEIKARHNEIEELLQRNVDTEILKEPWVMKGLKYALIEIAEAMANILQHILAKDMGEPVTGYVETVIKQKS